MTETRELTDLVSVGKAIAGAFKEIGITRVEQLIGQDANALFVRLEQIRGTKVDRCCEDVLRCAIAQAENPNLPKEECQWHYWSKIRKGQQ